MYEDRRFLRCLLDALIAGREDAQFLYIPRGKAGQRRMIRALLDIRPPEPEGTALHDMIARFEAMQENGEEQSPSPAGGTSSVFAFGESTFPKGEG